jgi:hypothetical protein
MRLQTLGDAIDERMRDRSDSLESAALDLGVTTDGLLAWLADERLPHAQDASAVLRFLDIDEGRYRGLCLRSQMRHVQVVIRYGSGETARVG